LNGSRRPVELPLADPRDVEFHRAAVAFLEEIRLAAKFYFGRLPF
jgi:hypothetical protein